MKWASDTRRPPWTHYDTQRYKSYSLYLDCGQMLPDI